jgi:hypothetical protein
MRKGSEVFLRGKKVKFLPMAKVAEKLRMRLPRLLRRLAMTIEYSVRNDTVKNF